MESMERPTSSRHNLKMRERNRRMRMKDLYHRLASVISPQLSRVTVAALVAETTSYISNLKVRIEEAKQRKEALIRGRDTVRDTSSSSSSLLPVLGIRSGDSTLDVNLITGLDKNFMLHEIISVLEEHGAEVVSVAVHNTGDRIIYVIQSKAVSARIGIETSSVQERLMDIIFW